MSLLLNPRLWLALGVVGLVVAIYWAGGAGARADLQEYRAAQAEAGRLAERSRRETERLWTDRVTEVANDAQAQKNALAPDVAAAGTAADKLHTAAAGAVRRACPRPSTAATGKGEPGADPLDLFVGMLERHSRELVEVGRFADDLRIAGLACERAYAVVAGANP